MSDRYNPFGLTDKPRPTPLVSAEALDALKLGFVEESSIAQMALSLVDKDNYSLIENRLLEFRAMDDMGDRPFYDFTQDPVVQNAPQHWLSILSNVKSTDERDIAIEMLTNIEINRNEKAQAGLT